MAFGAVDWQTRVFTFNYQETLNWVGYDLESRHITYGTTPRQDDLDYYGVGNTNAQRTCIWQPVYQWIRRYMLRL